MMTLPISLLRTIGNAVERAGGDLQDAEALVDVWERLDADLDRRALRIKFEASRVHCCCRTPAEPAPDGRCSRCWGRSPAR